jgi:hypothetical protein
MGFSGASKAKMVEFQAPCGRIVGKQEVMAQVGSYRDYFRLARHSGGIAIPQGETGLCFARDKAFI